jgi:hypothetical protein
MDEAGNLDGKDDEYAKDFSRTWRILPGRNRHQWEEMRAVYGNIIISQNIMKQPLEIQHEHNGQNKVKRNTF